MSRAKRKRDEAVQEYRAAIHSARAIGLPMTEIAKAAGTTRQAVEQILLRKERA